MSVTTEQHDPDPDFDELTGEVRFDGFREGRIQNFLGLAWAGRKAAEYERGIAQNEAVHASFLAEVERILEAKRKTLMGNSIERLAEYQAPLQKQAAFFRAAIESYAKDNKKTLLIGRAKSREIPDAGGLKLAWRGHDAGYRYDQRPGPDGKPPTAAQNRAALVAWAEGEQASRDEDLIPLVNPGPAVPDLEEIKEHAATIRITGVCDVFVPPGLEYIPAGETITVSVGEEESK